MKGVTPAILAGILALVLIGSIALIYMFPYNPTHPPIANSTNATPSGIEKVVSSNNEFAIGLLHELEQQNPTSNMFFSPYSIYSAMGMVYEGARGQTAEQMKLAMHLPDLQVLEPNFAALYNEINNNSRYYTLRTGNALWIQKGFKLNPDYEKRVAEFFGGKATTLDFVKDPRGSVKTINNFISKQTNGKITSLLSTSSVNKFTRMIITNAIYFKGTWMHKFDENKTYTQRFYTEEGIPVNVSMMHMYPGERRVEYAQINGTQLLKLPYEGNLSMIIILPKNGESIDNLLANMTWKDLKSWIGSMRPTRLSEIALPKFEFKKKYDLRGVLTSLGLGDLFASPDLSGIAKDLQVQSVIHEAYIKVDENGTEAAAATAVVIGVTAVNPSALPRFVADHPFMFLIQDDKTGAILFIGVIKDPSKFKQG